MKIPCTDEVIVSEARGKEKVTKSKKMIYIMDQYSLPSPRPARADPDELISPRASGAQSC